ncbi:hypothetical protein [Streptomyces sp. NPDC052693]|uniref:hypothetical protein n=1 Tax=Streptomyces sp. NPDC052693 TaxID=3155814 RepID=UPI00341FDFE8
MSRTLFLSLFLPLLAAECVAKWALHSQAWTIVFAVLGLAVIAVRWALGPQTAGEAEECPPGCPKCAESLSGGDR